MCLSLYPKRLTSGWGLWKTSSLTCDVYLTPVHGAWVYSETVSLFSKVCNSSLLHAPSCWLTSTAAASPSFLDSLPFYSRFLLGRTLYPFVHNQTIWHTYNALTHFSIYLIPNNTTNIPNNTREELQTLTVEISRLGNQDASRNL